MGSTIPTGSIRVTGTMPDGSSWGVWDQAIPAGATSPYIFSTSDQGLGTGEHWEDGVLAEGLYQFRAEYIPDEDSLFDGATSDIARVTVDAPEYEPGSPLPPSPVVGSLDGVGLEIDFRDWYDTTLAVGDTLSIWIADWSGSEPMDLMVWVLHDDNPIDGGCSIFYGNPDTWTYTVPTGGAGVYSLLVETTDGGGTYTFEYTVTPAPPAGWSDDFDSYAAGSDIHGQGGWQNIQIFRADTYLKVSNDFARSEGNSLEITPQPQNGDLRYVGYAYPQATSGVWEVSFWWYVPYATEHVFFQIDAQLYARQLKGDHEFLALSDGATFIQGTVITGKWVPVRYLVDLDNDTYQVWYNGESLYTGVFEPTSITFVVGALYGTSSTYIDDVSVRPVTP